MTDGVGGIALATLLFDLERHPKATLAAHRPTSADPDAAPAPSGAGLRRAAEATVWLMGRPARLLAADGRRAAERGARTILKLLAPMSSPMSPVMLGRGPRQRFSAFDVDLDQLRGAARACHASINDVFLAAVTGGLRRYHDEHGSPVDQLRIDLPISIRGDADAPGGNRFVPTRFALPIGEVDVRSRVQSVGAIARQWRDEPALQWTELLAGVLNRLPRPLLVSLFGGMLKNVDFVATNVPGFPMPVYFAGAKVLRQYAFAPPAGAAVNVALMSHGPHACIGVVFDRAAVPDVAAFTRCLREGFAEVAAVAHRPRARRAS
jgi:WS/DGAT/MGAT family acyltransferase